MNISQVITLHSLLLGHLLLLLLLLLRLLVLLRPLRHDADQVEEVLWLVTQQGLQVTDEPVDVALARCLVDDVFVVVVTEASRQLLIVHLRLVLPRAPTSSNL